MRPELPRELVLAIATSTHGIAFAYFEGPLSPVDWGIKDVRGGNKNAQALATVRTLVEQLQPDVLILEDDPSSQAPHLARQRRLRHLIASYAASQAIEVVRYVRSDVLATFSPSGATKRYEVAQLIASQVPAFSFRLPPRRKLWMTADRRMPLFDAAALAITYFAKRGLLSPYDL
jgi:hypothetical protein